MAKNKTSSKKQAEKERRKLMAARQTQAIENARLRASEGGASPMHGKKSAEYSHTADQLVGGKIEGTEVDAAFASDIQKMKFCRKPVGFIMWLLYLVLIVAMVAPFLISKMELNLGIDQFVALCMEKEVAASSEQLPVDGENTENAEEGGEASDENAENAAAMKLYADDEPEEGTEEGGESEESGNASSNADSQAKLYGSDDVVFGWLKFVAGKFNLVLELGDSEWYDTQVSKTEVGMVDALASILILAYPPFIVIYIALAFVLMIQTLICFASGDRRIFRFTGIENIIMLLCGAVVLLGSYASATEIDATMDLSGIVTFLLGGVTGAGGFTAGYGLLIMLAVPVVGFILSFFLLEKKFRGREITQPIIVYHYKEK